MLVVVIGGIKKLIANIKKSTKNNRIFRRYLRVLLRWILIAVLVWLLLFFYSFLYKFQNTLKNNINSLFRNSPEEKMDSNQNQEFSEHLGDTFVEFDSRKKDLELTKSLDAKSLEFYKQIQRRPYDVNCRNLIEWNEEEVRRAKRILFKLNNLNTNRALPPAPSVADNGELSNSIPLLNDENYRFPSSKCHLFRELRGYDRYKVTDFELKFPIAYSILVYNNVEQLERLLKSVYRAHNVYCIHVDLKSSSRVHEAVRSIVSCFSNVFIATRLEHIVYAGFPRLRADLNCMNDLIDTNLTHPNLAGKRFSRNWKYLLNLASSEFPLRTNYELTKILHMFNGANDIEVMTKFQIERIKYSWKVKMKENSSMEYMVRTKRLKTEVPHNYTIVKGITYCSFSRKFVEYVLTNQYAKDLLKWSEDTYSPDEWYWATVNYNIQFNPPGGFKDPSRFSVPTKARYIGWRNSYKCMGELRHGICVFAIEDLPELVTRNEFFLNKFLLEYDPIAYQCMEEWLYNRAISYQAVSIIHYCRLIFVIPYSINPSCARLIENKNYKKKP